MEKIISEIVKKVFNKKPLSITQITGKGVVNLVYKVVVKKTSYILRMQKEKTALNNFKKEKWAIEKARKAGIRTPKCIAIGKYKNYAYSFQQYVEGLHGEDHLLDKNYVWKELGKAAKIIHTIDSGGFGEDFNQKNKIGVDSWKEIMKWIEEYIFDNDFFTKHKVFSKTEMKKIKTILKEMEHWNFVPKLCHGNLTPRNAIVDQKKQVHIVDWGTACGNIVPHREVAELLTWDTSPKNVDAFLGGYGVKKGEILKKEKRIVELLILLRVLSAVRWGIENKENWKKEDFVIFCIKKAKKIIA